MKRILISGGSGLLGSRLTEILEKRNFKVAHLSRSEGNGKRETIVWDVAAMKLQANSIEKFDHIIHLAGAGIVDRAWTEARKKEIVDSRVKSTQLLKEAISRNERKPESFVSASAPRSFLSLRSELAVVSAAPLVSFSAHRGEWGTYFF